MTCNSSEKPSSGRGGVGTLSLALVATTNEHTYRLRHASFVVSGPTSTVLDSESDPGAVALTAVLDTGAYALLLSGSWSLERLDPGGFAQVDATVTSTNPAAFSITAGVTTSVPFRFATNGIIVVIGTTGTVSITTEVTEVGQDGGSGTGDSTSSLGMANPGFEHGLDGWVKTGTAFDTQPTYHENVNGSRVNPVTIGGDYWTELAFPIGVRGDYWIGTKDNRPTARAMRGQVQGDAPTGTLTSMPFRIPWDTQFITFLIGGGENHSDLNIELLSGSAGRFEPVEAIEPKTGLDSEILRRDWWNVGTLDKLRDYAIRITDNATGNWGHINVDDIRFETADPQTAKLGDGRPSVLHTAINGRAVWTDYDAKLWGAADLHTHLMSHLSMGGKLMHGAPDIGSLAPAGTIKQGSGCNQTEITTTTLEDTLPDCSATHGGWGVDNTCGDTIRAAAINVGYDSEFEHKIKFPSEGTCDPGMSMEAGLCWQTCSAGFHGFATTCRQDCPPAFHEDLGLCTKTPAYDRGVGYLLQNDDQRACERDNPQGCEQFGLIWYPKCATGFHGLAGTCTMDCPAGFGDLVVSCLKPGPHSRGGGYNDPFSDNKVRCERDFPQGCDQCLGAWFPKCGAGFHETLCVSCTADCPAGMTEMLGGICKKNADYGRGNGYLNHTDDKGACERDNPRGCEQCGAPFFPKCAAGFHALGCNFCSRDCPAGMTDIGLACAPGVYGRGPGTPPLTNAHGDHQHAGWPTMRFWPHWSTKAHQQMYVDWIKRAHDGGLNVLVTLAVNNALLGEVVNGENPKDDRDSADQQVAEIRSFIGRHTDFMTEAGSAVELRQAVKAGKLAVVVGVEVDNIGNFNVANPALIGDEAAVKGEIQRLYNNGVRYIFPMHFADNVFGGAAVYGALFNFSNRFARTRPYPIGLPVPPGFLYKVETASDPLINYRLEILDGRANEWAAGLTINTAKAVIDAIGATPFPPALDFFSCPVPMLACVPQFKLLSSLLSPDPEWDEYALVPGGQVNQKSLTQTGEAAIREMMRLGMIIDIDHMSDKAANRTLEIAESFSYPVNSGHTGFRYKPGQEKVNENLRTPEQLTRLGHLGGMMGVGWAAADAETYLQNYRFALQHGGIETCTTDRLMNTTCALTTPPAFSLGSDINGFEQMPKARNSHVDYCTGDADCQANPKKLRLYMFGTTAEGQPRIWNYNNPPGADASHTGEGVAHIGLYPDFYQDLKDLGMSEDERSSFFGAAEALARMWDKIEAQKTTVH